MSTNNHPLLEATNRKRDRSPNGIDLFHDDDDDDCNKSDEQLMPPRKKAKYSTKATQNTTTTKTASNGNGDEDVDMQGVSTNATVDVSASFADMTMSEFTGTFIAVRLDEIMPPAHIVRGQIFMKDTLAQKKEVLANYRKYMRSEIKKKSAFGRQLVHMMSRNEDGEAVLPKYVLRSVHQDWDCSVPGIYDMIVSLLSGRSSEWTHDVSQAAFVIGEIVDPANPAKKYVAESGVQVQKVYGLFATADICQNTLLFEYAGCVCPIGVATQKLNHLESELSHTTLFDLIGHLDANRAKPHWGHRANDQLVIDTSKYHNEGVYMNDYRDNVMDDPDDDEQLQKVEKATGGGVGGRREQQQYRKQNVKFYEVLVNNWPRVFAVAICDIEPGQELLGDYGQEYWKNFRVMMMRRQDLMEIKQTIHAEWQGKYDLLRQECDGKQQQIEQLLKDNNKLSNSELKENHILRDYSRLNVKNTGLNDFEYPPSDSDE